MNFFEAVETRRSVYALNKEVKVSDDRIKEIVEHAVKHVPSSFNSQSTRVVVLFKGEHEKLWDMTTEVLKAVMGDADFSGTQQKMDMFKGAYGTVLFFEDQAVIAGLQEAFPAYAENFPIWSEQTSGMHQFAVWTAFATEGVGASLQHYNPLVDERIANEWNVPESWKLRAQMPFGGIAQPAGDKEFKSLDERIKFFG
ncbi:nitroreductase family protein [Paenibacillus gallinarum]|uniref:Nitroreductase family protein n=1 Tax=Paenibacillus gallinarum TaxID=2762232 RepID=A0ABR8SSQ6_9BACL|nr:nitroreductase family protein [Paenibacillus gallinarum]MBD7966530.1 nitroreductase family protein [Paenibacillus gallinarum]